jgi:hypothetical protein
VRVVDTMAKIVSPASSKPAPAAPSAPIPIVQYSSLID